MSYYLLFSLSSAAIITLSTPLLPSSLALSLFLLLCLSTFCIAIVWFFPRWQCQRTLTSGSHFILTVSCWLYVARCRSNHCLKAASNHHKLFPLIRQKISTGWFSWQGVEVPVYTSRLDIAVHSTPTDTQMVPLAIATRYTNTALVGPDRKTWIVYFIVNLQSIGQFYGALILSVLMAIIFSGTTMLCIMLSGNEPSVIIPPWYPRSSIV